MGKILRKAQRRLNLRIHGEQQGKRPDRNSFKGDKIEWGKERGYRMPGSLKK